MSGNEMSDSEMSNIGEVVSDGLRPGPYVRNGHVFDEQIVPSYSGIPAQPMNNLEGTKAPVDMYKKHKSPHVLDEYFILENNI